MEVRFIIVTLACLSCLIQPALGTGLVKTAAIIGGAKGAIIGGIKGAAVGAGVGALAEGAAALVTKKALLNIAMKAAALKGEALLAAKKAAIQGIGTLAKKGITAATGLITALSQKTRIDSPVPSILDILSGAVRIAQSFNQRHAVQVNVPVVYRMLRVSPRICAVPVELIAVK